MQIMKINVQFLLKETLLLISTKIYLKGYHTDLSLRSEALPAEHIQSDGAEEGGEAVLLIQVQTDHVRNRV